MSSSARRKELAASQRKMLMDKVRVVEDRIRGLELQKNSTVDDISNDSCWTGAKESYVRQDRKGEEAAAVSQRCVQASLEILGINISNYNQVILPPQPGLPGLYKETTMQMVINEIIGVCIVKVTNNKDDDPNQIISLRCHVKGRLHRKETEGLTEAMCASKNLAGLTRGLRTYAKLASARLHTLNNLANKYKGFFQAHTSDSGMIIEWEGNAFHMFWTVQWDDCFECIVDNINVEVYRRDSDFMEACQPILFHLTSKSSTIELRNESLLKFAALANS